MMIAAEAVWNNARDMTYCETATAVALYNNSIYLAIIHSNTNTSTDSLITVSPRPLTGLQIKLGDLGAH